MAWKWIIEGKEIDWDGDLYVVTDLGSDGNCLFHSLAFVFCMAGEQQLASTAYREAATAQLIDWVGDLPDWFDDQHYETPNADRVNDLVEGDWGDLTCMLAILSRLHPDYFINILNISQNGALTDETYLVDLSAAGIESESDVSILYLGNNHYVALTPKDREEEIADVSNALVDLNQKEQKIGQVSCKLSTSSGLSRKINTVSKDSQAAVEIHQINVGIGDATLFLFQDAKGKYVQSILVDCGRDSQYVAAYFDHLDQLGRFRPVDIFVATHYDNDHIGAATTILGTKKYVNDSLRLIDQGEPFFGAQDYESYKKAFGEANQKPRELADLETPLFFDKDEDVEFRIVAMNGMVLSDSDGKYLSVNEAYSDVEIPKKLVCGEGSPMDWFKLNLAPQNIIPFDPNDTSLAIYLRYGSFRYFGAGDLNGDAERSVAWHVHARYFPDDHICVAKLNHHGAHESSHPDVIWHFRPRIALVSCGVPNTNGHPSPLALDRMEQLAAIYPAQTLITADLSQNCPKDTLPWATSGQFKSSLDNQGSIVVLVPHAMAHAKDHGFATVTGTRAQAQLHQCGDRDWDKKNPIKDTLKKPGRSEEQKKASLKRKAERKQDAEKEKQDTIGEMIIQLRRLLGRSIDEAFPMDETKAKQWKAAVEQELAGLAGRLYRTDDSAREQRVSTVSKNFGKEVSQFDTIEQMQTYLSKQK